MRKLCQLWGTMIKKYFLNRKNIYLRQNNKKKVDRGALYFKTLNLNLKHAGTHPPPLPGYFLCFSIKVICFFRCFKTFTY